MTDGWSWYWNHENQNIAVFKNLNTGASLLIAKITYKEAEFLVKCMNSDLSLRRMMTLITSYVGLDE